MQSVWFQSLSYTLRPLQRLHFSCWRNRAQNIHDFLFVCLQYLSLSVWRQSMMARMLAAQEPGALDLDPKQLLFIFFKWIIQPLLNGELSSTWNSISPSTEWQNWMNAFQYPYHINEVNEISGEKSRWVSLRLFTWWSLRLLPNTTSVTDLTALSV